MEEVNVSDAIKGLRGADGLLWLPYVTCDLLKLAVGMPSMRRLWQWWRKCRENLFPVRSQLPWRQPGHGLFLEVMVGKIVVAMCLRSWFGKFVVAKLFALLSALAESDRVRQLLKRVVKPLLNK